MAALLTLRASAAFLSPASSGAAVRSSLRPLRAADTALAEETLKDASADVAAGAGGEGAAAEGVPYDPAAWRRGWQGAKAEGAGAVEAVEGALPSDLVGTYYHNGPASFVAKGGPVARPYEGDGMMTALTLDGAEGRAYARNRFVRTTGYTKEENLETKQDLFDRFLTAALTGSKNTANGGAVYWGGYLLALWDGGLPHRVDALSLGTQGTSLLGGALKKEAKEPFSGRPLVDAARKRLVNFGVRATPLPASTLVKFSEFNAQFRPASEATRVKLPGFGALHDFAFTKKYYVLVQSPTSQAVAARKLGGRVAPGACLEIDKAKPTLVHLVPRGTGFIDAVEPISIEARSCVLAPLPLARPPPRAARARWSLIRE